MGLVVKAFTIVFIMAELYQFKKFVVFVVFMVLVRLSVALLVLAEQE